jgi:hypothetical protein
MTLRNANQSLLFKRRCGGFVLLIALAMFSVVSVAILALALSMSADGRRTFDRARQSQLDQLLLAGASHAVEHLKQTTPRPGDTWQIDLPQSLSDESASLQSTVDASSDPGAGQVVLHIQARIDNRSAEQIVKMVKGANGWRIAEARIPGE